MEASQVNQSPDSQHLTTIQKRHKKLMGEMQQLTNNLNWLINENNKLKGQVDSSRNSRVIYWNVYKTLEKEIHKNEYLYRVALVDSLCYEETDLKVKEKLENTVRKLEKEIGELSGGMVKKKNMKRKSRLDTGLSTIRVPMQIM